jgi:capsular polysaccharide biosynthesis protein
VTRAVRTLFWRLAVRFERELRLGRAAARRVLVVVSRLLRALPGTSWRVGPPRHYTYDTYTWALDTGAAHHEVDPPWQTNRTLVEARGQVLPHQFVDSLKWQMPRTFVLTFDDARLWGADSILVTSDDTVLADQTNAFRLRPEELPILRRARLGRPTRLPGVSATISGAYAESYYHWMFDLLPRLDLLRRSGLAFDRLIVPDSLGYQRETLEAAGVDAEHRLNHTDAGYLHLDRLLFPSMPGTPGQSPPAVCEFLRSLFPDEIADQARTRRLYLSRADTNRRKLANEDTILKALEPFGFESMTMSGRSVAEQARLFAQAEAIVAPHGGALANLVFCQPGTKVVELFPPGYTPVCFWTIADAVGLDYRPLFDDSSAPHDGIAQWVPYEIAPARVLQALSSLGVAGAAGGSCDGT